MSNNNVANKLTIQRNKTLFTVAIILMLALTSATAVIPQSSAQAAKAQEIQIPTPSEWRTRLTETPEGAYRPTVGVTNYPLTTSPCGNEPKTGFSKGPAPYTNHTLWRADIPVYEWSQILADNGKVFTGSTLDHCYYCLDQNTGEVIWQFNLTGGSQRWPQLAFHTAWVLDSSRAVALSQNNGNAYYKMTVAGSPALSVKFPQVFEDGDAIYLTSGNNVSCLKLSHTEFPSVSLVWNQSTIRGRLAYADGLLYGVASYSTWCSCVEAATGKLVWNFTGTGDPKDKFYPSPVIDNGLVFLGTETNNASIVADHVVCLDAKTGAYKWTYATGEYFVQSISAGYGNIYVAGGEQNNVYCIDQKTGNLIWKHSTPGVIDYYTMQIGGGAVYLVCAAMAITGFPVAGTYPGYTICLNATTGDEIWRYWTPTSATDVSLVDGNLYTETIEDYIWCWGKGPTTTTTTATSQAITLGQSTVIYGSVEDMSPFSQQHPELQYPWVKGVPITLSYIKDGGWVDFAKLQTNDYGEFEYAWTASETGAYTVIARFEGNDAYYWSSGKTMVQVSPAPPSPSPKPTATQAATPTPTPTLTLPPTTSAPSPSQTQAPPPAEAPNLVIYVAIAAVVIVAVVVAVAVYLRKRR
ncbi:MAG: PQQ-binding-like beta-propeller repeat protein [Candidatus Bathyarchaeia archaeon]